MIIVKNKEQSAPVHVVLFISRNKDNTAVANHKTREKCFITREPMDSSELAKQFNNFVNDGQYGEMSRMYYSVNERNEQNIRKDLMHFLIDNPDANMCDLSSKIASIASSSKNAKTRHWMFDFDIKDKDKAEEFCHDITEIDDKCKIATYETPNGFAIILNHGIDVRPLLKKWGDSKVTLKRDDMLCCAWAIRS